MSSLFGGRKTVRRGTTNASAEAETRSGSSSQSFTNIATEYSEPPTLPSRSPSSPLDQDAGDSSSNEVAGSDYAKKCKALMELYRVLRSLGADMFFELPKIAVIGAQSAGKSSLIEAVSGISVPRDSGICTRCPVELSMTSFVDEWSCRISLRIEYDEFNQQQGNSTCIPFCTLSSNEKSSVDLWLRRAQASILYRQRPVSDFQNMDLQELRRLKPGEGSMLSFSMNVIEVNLQDPEATDLTFVDLPGLIQNASDGDIFVAQDLVKKNIEGDRTLILITIPMSDEMENQEAVRLAKQNDESGIRTIGVLTKPDTITRGAIGSRQRWKEVLQGKIYPLQHGYYCVRLADDDERTKRLSRTEAEALSTEFFARNEPWSDFVDRTRFGVPNFVNDISRLLLGLIETNLPNLKIEVDKLILECSNELNAMPIAPTREPSTEILLRLSDFCREVHKAVMGKDHKFLAHNNKAHYEAFKSAIQRTSPDFWPFSSKENHMSPGLHIQGSNGPFDLQDVRNEIKEALTWELPGIIPYDAIRSLVLKGTTTWRNPTVECFESVFRSTSSTVETLIARHFKQFTKLETLIKALSHSELEVCKVEAMSHLDKLLRHESVPLYTQNISYLVGRKSQWLRDYTNTYQRSSHYFVPPSVTPANFGRIVPSPQVSTHASGGKKYRRARSPSPAMPKSEPAILEYSPPPSRSHSPTHIPSPSYDDELSVMATVSAYFEVASKRFVDHIPLAIEHQLNQTFSEKIHQALVEDIMSGPDVSGRMKDLLSEDEAIALRRQFLEQRLERLREIEERLAQFKLVA